MQSNHSFAESRFPRLSFLRLTRNHGLLVCFCAQKMPKQALHRLDRFVVLLKLLSHSCKPEAMDLLMKVNMVMHPGISAPLQGSKVHIPWDTEAGSDGGQETEQPFHWTIFQRQLLGITPLNTVYILPGSGVRFTL